MKAARIGLLSIFAVFGLAASSMAQSAPTPAFGAFAGVNQSYFATQPKNPTNAKQGFVVGAFGVLRRERAIKIQPELQITQRKVEASLANVFQTSVTTYASLGLLLRTNLFKGIYSTQGVQLMLPVVSTLDINGVELDLKDNINQDVTLIVGLGRQFGRIGIEGRWDSGFKAIEKAPIGNFVKRNRAITVIGIVAF